MPQSNVKESDEYEKIHKINWEVKIQVIVSLSCTMCPELVMVVQRIALVSLVKTWC